MTAETKAQKFRHAIALLRSLQESDLDRAVRFVEALQQQRGGKQKQRRQRFETKAKQGKEKEKEDA